MDDKIRSTGEIKMSSLSSIMHVLTSLCCSSISKDMKSVLSDLEAVVSLGRQSE